MARRMPRVDGRSSRHAPATLAHAGETLWIGKERPQVELDVVHFVPRTDERDRIVRDGGVPTGPSHQAGERMVPNAQLASGRFPHRREAEVHHQIGGREQRDPTRWRRVAVQCDMSVELERLDACAEYAVSHKGPYTSRRKRSRSANWASAEQQCIQPAVATQVAERHEVIRRSFCRGVCTVSSSTQRTWCRRIRERCEDERWPRLSRCKTSNTTRECTNARGGTRTG